MGGDAYRGVAYLRRYGRPASRGDMTGPIVNHASPLPWRVMGWGDRAVAWEGLGSWWSILAGKGLDARELRSLSGLSDAKSFRQLYPCRDVSVGRFSPIFCRENLANPSQTNLTIINKHDIIYNCITYFIADN